MKGGEQEWNEGCIFWPTIMATANHHRYFENFITLFGCAGQLAKGGRISSASFLENPPHHASPLTQLGFLETLGENSILFRITNKD